MCIIPALAWLKMVWMCNWAIWNDWVGSGNHLRLQIIWFDSVPFCTIKALVESLLHCIFEELNTWNRRKQLIKGWLGLNEPKEKQEPFLSCIVLPPWHLTELACPLLLVLFPCQWYLSVGRAQRMGRRWFHTNRLVLFLVAAWGVPSLSLSGWAGRNFAKRWHCGNRWNGLCLGSA